MIAGKMRVVCAWCRQVVSDAPNGTGVTHTICPSCLNRMVTLSPHTGGIDPAALLPAPDYFGDAFKH